MTPLVHLLLALGAIGLAESGARPLLASPLGVLALVLGPRLLRSLALRLGTRGRFRAAALAAAAIGWWPPFATLVAVVPLGWHADVLRWSGEDAVLLGWPKPALLLGLAPFVAYETAAVRELARLAGRRPEEVARRVRFQLRQLLVVAVPLALLVAAGAFVSSRESLRVVLEEVRLAGALGGIGAAVLLAVFLPFLVSWAWDTAPLRGREHPWQAPLLERVARECGLGYRGLRVWRTGHLVANAAVVGFAPFHRFVLFTDLLLAQLGPRELVAVFAHEAGHARRHHVALFASWAFGFVLLVDWGLNRLPPGNELLVLGVFAALLVAGAAGFGYLARRIELDADLAALELTGDAGGLAQALEVAGGMHARRSSWRHFGLGTRVAFLGRAAENPSVGRALRARLRTWAVGGALVLIAGAGLQAVELMERLPADLVRADLRLGRYDRALERAEGAEGRVPLPLLALAQRAAADPAGDGASGAHWEERAREAALRGDAGEAGAYLSLAVLRGRAELAPVLEALAEGNASELEEPWNRLTDATEAWGPP